MINFSEDAGFEILSSSCLSKTYAFYENRVTAQIFRKFT